MRKPINMRLPVDLLARVDAEAERLGQTRTKFVERALESALATRKTRLDGAPVGSPDQGVTHSPASSRASKHNVRPVDLPGVKTARELALERQRRLNEGKG